MKLLHSLQRYIRFGVLGVIGFRILRLMGGSSFKGEKVHGGFGLPPLLRLCYYYHYDYVYDYDYDDDDYYYY